MNSLTQVNPEILLVEHAKISTRSLKQIEAIIVKCRRMNLFAKKHAHPITHLSGRGHCIGEGEYSLRLRVPLLDKAGNTVD